MRFNTNTITDRAAYDLFTPLRFPSPLRLFTAVAVILRIRGSVSAPRHPLACSHFRPGSVSSPRHPLTLLPRQLQWRGKRSVCAMDPIKASSDPAIATPTKKALAFSSSTPVKGKNPVPSDNQFWTPTPEKPAQRSRRGCGSSIAFSVNEVRQAALGLCKKDVGINEKLDRDLALVEKQLRSKKAVQLSSFKAKDEIQLPHKYQILCEIFNCMECSIRLLRLRGSMPTFSNLYARIQDLANQNLTYKQLAQIKHILPEAIIIKKVLLRDESTCCMKPELQISMNAEGIGINTKEEGQTAYLHLRKVFKERLVDFFRDHPEVYDVTKFLDDLPGGEDVLLHASASGDATDAFENVGHSSSAEAMMEKYLLGSVDGYVAPHVASGVTSKASSSVNTNKPVVIFFLYNC